LVDFPSGREEDALRDERGRDQGRVETEDAGSEAVLQAGLGHDRVQPAATGMVLEGDHQLGGSDRVDDRLLVHRLERAEVHEVHGHPALLQDPPRPLGLAQERAVGEDRDPLLVGQHLRLPDGEGNDVLDRRRCGGVADVRGGPAADDLG
jgi:hypothetical protein